MMGAGVCRVAVVGSPGSGKTRLSRGLAETLALPLICLDDEYWGPGWARPDSGAWRDKVAELASGDRWIIDGNHAPTLEQRFRRAQLIVLVDTPPLVCSARIVRRVLRIRAGRTEELPGRLREQAEGGVSVRAGRDLGKLLKLALLFRRRGRREVLAAAARHDLPVVAVPWPTGVKGCIEPVQVDRQSADL